ncbi:MAG: restriction endonuclease [Bacteroidia bacterium]
MTKRRRNKLEREDWKDYELQILKLYRELYPKKFVLDNQMIVGRHSLKKRQVDVVIYSSSLTLKIFSIVECKNLSRKVTLTYIDSLQGKMEDLGVTRASIVTTQGFSDGVKNYAENKNIELRKIDYEYLKDYYYMPPTDVPEIFTKATRYCLPYCEACNISPLFEIGEVYGMAEHEPLYCPKCKIQLTEVRSDANHRIIKLFLGN